MFGQFGKLLIIDLTNQNIVEKELEEVQFKELLGGKGMALNLLLKMLPPGSNPLGPDNLIVLSAGPAVGLDLAAAAGCSIYSRSPLNGLFCGKTGNSSSPLLTKRAGFDLAVLTGVADLPCFIIISEVGVSFYDASEIWKSGTCSAQKVIETTAGGENTDYYIANTDQIFPVHLQDKKPGEPAAGLDEIDAVFQSKKLKAIVTRGTAKADLFDERGLLKWNELMIRTLPKPSFSPKSVVEIIEASSNRPAEALIDYEDKLNIFHCLSLDDRYLEHIHWGELSEMIGLISGEEYSVARLKEMAAKVQDDSRLFNLREGVTGIEKTFLSGFFEKPSEESESKITLDQFDKILHDYYLLRRWDQNGIPPEKSRNIESNRRNLNVS